MLPKGIKSLEDNLAVLYYWVETLSDGCMENAMVYFITTQESVIRKLNETVKKVTWFKSTVTAITFMKVFLIINCLLY
jgi:hypothetical protein